MAGYGSWDDRPWERTEGRDWERWRRERSQGDRPGDDPSRERTEFGARERDEWRDRWRGEEREGWRGERDERGSYPEHGRHAASPTYWEPGERRGGRPRMDRPWVEPSPERRNQRDTRGMYEWEDRGPLEWLGDKIRHAQRRPSRGPKGYSRSDDRIHEEVCERIARSGVNADEVEVRVEKHEVTLTGTVPSREDKWWLEDLVDDVFGVEEVHNQLRVQRGERTGAATTTQH